MRGLSRHFGLAGLILAGLGLLGYGAVPMFKGFHLIPWTFAVLLWLIYVPLHRDTIGKFMGSRSARYGTGAVIATLLVLGTIVIVAMLTARHSVRWDLTSDKRHSLAPQTVKVLESLTADVSATAFFLPGKNAFARTLLEDYAHHSDRFKFELVDPDRNPVRTKTAGITRYDTVVVRSGGQSEKVTTLTESNLTNAIVRVTRPGRKVIYFLAGHGEKDIDDPEKDGLVNARGVLEDQNYDVKPLVLMQNPRVPENAAVLVLAGPQKDLLESETEAIDEYLRAGGKVLFMIDPETAPGLDGFLEKFDVSLGENIIVDKMSRLFGAGYLMPLVAEYIRHPIVEDFKVASFFPMARTVEAADKKIEGIEVKALAFTSDQAWAETDLAGIKNGQARFDKDRDRPGPVPVAVVGTVQVKAEQPDQATQPTDKPGQGKFLVFGDSDFAANSYFDFQGNGDLFLKSVSWLAEEADLVAVRPKDVKNQPLMLSAIQASLVFWGPVVFLPLIILSLGFVILTAGRKDQ